MSTSVNYRLLGIASGVIALASVPVLAQQRSGSGNAAAEAAVAKSRSAYEQASNGQNAAGIAKLYTADGVEMPPHAPIQKGRAAIEAYHKTLFTQVMVHNLVIKATETRVMGDTAIDIGTYSQQLMTIKGSKTSDDKGKYIVLLRKDAGGTWLITHAIYNSDVPLPAPPATK